MNTARRLAFFFITAAAIFSGILYFSCRKDACKTVNCLNGGTCSAGTCNCPIGWVGNFCQTSAFAGTWSGVDTCASLPYNVTMSIDASSTDTTTFLVLTPHNISGSLRATKGSITSLTINSQPIDTMFMSGSVTLNTNTSLTFTYIIRDSSGATVSCSGTYTRL